ncbi:DUF6397 family protein [Streptomyces brasiliensis]|uniref:Uncharacterized protein n=1 Tax=Streptomyces brasiliensis TaxID=1954 RepID=A0A917PAY9_9ACTN|nr:DUF6397 family protein [Streptomyces brasiliensis]GGJ68752.1 hypothetical protein GCM10010121_094330 [Streptomyces brasiliensis]
MSADIITQPRALSYAPSRAARELELKRGEFDLAVDLGRIRTVPDEGGGGGPRVERAEIDRLRLSAGFPEALRESVRAVGTTEAAYLMGVAAGRFTRLARLGLVIPVKFHLNRYRAVVWLYLADEVRQFAADEKNAPLLTGRTPERLRGRLGAGADLRARNWRGRRLGFLLRQAHDPWEHAGAVAAFLDPVHVAEVVKDPCERSHLNRFRPGPPAHGVPGSPAAHLAEKITTADGPDEIDWLRSDLARAVEEARAHRPAPRPGPRENPPGPRSVQSANENPPAPRPPEPRSATTGTGLDEAEPEAQEPSRGLLGRLLRRSRPAGL